MSGAGDSPDRILDDLLTWIRQNGGDDQGWYLEEAPPEGLADPAPPEEAPAPEPRKAAPAPKPAAARPAAQDTPDDDPFQKECDRFVADTLSLIARRKEAGADDALPVTDPESKAAALDALRLEVLPCTKCDLSAGRTHTVFGAGSFDADVVFVGEAPGAEEDKQGEPFVGRSGQLLTKILEAIGYAREDVFICNILKCRPPNNRDPERPEVLACEPHLKAQLAILNPKVICCLGRVAAQTLLQTDASLGKLRAGVHFYAGIPVLATYHPAALLRHPAWKRDTWNDVRKLRALVDALNAD